MQLQDNRTTIILELRKTYRRNRTKKTYPGGWYTVVGPHCEPPAGEKQQQQRGY